VQIAARERDKKIKKGVLTSYFSPAATAAASHPVKISALLHELAPFIFHGPLGDFETFLAVHNVLWTGAARCCWL